MLSLITLAILVFSSVNLPEPGHCQHARAPRRRAVRPWRSTVQQSELFLYTLRQIFCIKGGENCSRSGLRPESTLSPRMAGAAQHKGALGKGWGRGGAAAQPFQPGTRRTHGMTASPGITPLPHEEPGAVGCGTGPGVFFCRANPVLASRTSSCTSPPSGAAPRTAATSPLLRASAPAFSASSQRSVAQLSGTSGDRRRESRACYASARPPWGSAAGLRPEPRGQRGAGSGERLVQPTPAAAATLGGLGTPKTVPPHAKLGHAAATTATFQPGSCHVLPQPGKGLGTPPVPSWKASAPPRHPPWQLPAGSTHLSWRFSARLSAAPRTP